MSALSSDHQSKVKAMLGRVNAGDLTDADDAARELDAILTRKEARAVLAARAKLMADMRDSFAGSDEPHDGGPGGPPPPGGAFGPGGPPPGAGFAPGGGQPGSLGAGPGGPGPGGPGPGSDRDGPPGDGGRRLSGHAMHDDAGMALLMLNLDRDQMHALFMNGRPPQ
jgi:hypothetical protein